VKKLLTAILLLIGVTAAVNRSSNETITLTTDNHILFSGPVTGESVAQAQSRLSEISANLSDSETIYIVLDTPGGSVSAGNLFIDYAKSLPQKIKPICLFCASMGYHMFQAFDERIVYSSSTLMSHRAALGGLSGQVPGELETRLSAIKTILVQMDAMAAKRVGLSTEAYQKLIYDELWLDGQTAVDTKHADRIAKIRCSEVLVQSRRTEVVRTFFGPVTVTYSNCPLISGVLDAKIGDNTKFRSVDEAIATVKRDKRTISWTY
jgi:ATP-dependent protease ClpP protease subunit